MRCLMRRTDPAGKNNVICELALPQSEWDGAFLIRKMEDKLRVMLRINAGRNVKDDGHDQEQ